MAIYLLLKFIAIFPLSFLQRIALWIAHFFFHTNSSIKQITTINLKLAYPELNEPDLQELIRRSIQSQCMTYIEFVKCWGMHPQYSLDLLKNIHGAELLEKALANQKGVIVVVPHFGCWELLNAWLNLYTQPMIMYKPDKIKGVNRYILDARQKGNASLVPTNKTGIRQIFKHLKQGGLTVVLPDHLPKASGGIYSHFFQQTAADKATKGSAEGEYLHNPHEQEGFANQVEFLANHFGDDEAEDYVDDLLDHHDEDDNKDLKNKLMENI